MRLLLTRPEPAASETRARLEAAGHDVVLAPLLVFAPTRPLPEPQGPFQAVLATSANALRAIAGSALAGRLSGSLLLAVGERTAEAAQAAGFDAVPAAGTAEALADLAVHRLDPNGLPVLVLEPRDRSCDLAGRLEAAGFRVERACVYAMEAVDVLPEPVCEALASGRIGGVLLYSARTASAFARAWRACPGDAQPRSGVPVLFCLSARVAAEAKALGAPVETAAEPTEPALFAMLAGR